MKIQKLYHSKLFKQLRPMIEILLSEMIEYCPEREIKINQNYTLTRSEEYAKSIFEKLSNLINTIEQLNFIPIFISKYKPEKIFLENGINHERFIQYHLENHFLKITSILDQSIILVNEIHDLGITSKSVSLRLLRENKHMKNVPSINLLKEFEKGI